MYPFPILRRCLHIHIYIDHWWVIRPGRLRLFGFFLGKRNVQFSLINRCSLCVRMMSKAPVQRAWYKRKTEFICVLHTILQTWRSVKVYNVYMNMDVVVSFFFHLSCLPSCPPVVPLQEHSYFWRLFVIAQPRWHCTWILCISMYDDILIDLHLGRRNHFLRIVCSIYICFTHSGGVEANIFKVSVEWWSVVN